MHHAAAWNLSTLEGGLLISALLVFLGASWVGVRVVGGKRGARGLETLLAVGTLSLTGVIVAAWIRTGRVPAVHRYELLVLAAWGLSAALWWVNRWSRQPVLASVTAPSLALLTLFALLLVPPGGAEGLTVRAGLYAHILLAIVGCAAFTFAAGVGVLYLWEIRVLKTNPTAAVARRLPPLEQLDRINFLAAALGFPFLLLSVVAGWLFVGRGSIGSWLLDPTVLVTLSGLVVYVLLFGARGFLGWRGRRIAWLTVVGFLVVVVGIVVAALCTSENVMHAS